MKERYMCEWCFEMLEKKGISYFSISDGEKRYVCKDCDEEDKKTKRKKIWKK